MCVIMASQQTPVSTAQIEAGFKENPYGAGLAWIDRSDPKRPVTRWRKGLTDVGQVVDLFKAHVKEGDPYVLHFRIPTEGLEDVELTHPFPISEAAENAFEGETTGLVLFHNGGWSTWRTESLAVCRSTGRKLPKGMLNDSRMLAWSAAIHGEEVLQLINEKVIVFGLNEDGSDHFQLYGTDKTNGWNFKGDRDTAAGVWFSNDRYEKHLPKEPIRNLRDIKEFVRNQGARGHQPQGGGTFRTDRQLSAGSGSLPGRDAQQKQVEGSQARSGSRPEPDGKLANDPAFIAKMGKVHTDPDALADALAFDPNAMTRRVIGFIAAQRNGKQLVH